MNKRLIILTTLTIFLVLLLPKVSAELNSVILASTENYPDALIAAPVTEKLGVPLLLVNKDEIPPEVKDFLKENKPQEVVLVGGPAVITKRVEENLNRSYNVTRLWGLTRYETAIKFSTFFWPEGSKKAILVQDDMEWLKGLKKKPKILSFSKELSKKEGIPIFLIPMDAIPLEVLSSLKQLEVKEVTLIGTNITPSIKEDLKELNITISQEISGNEKEVLKKVKEKIKNKIMKRGGTLIVPGVANYKDSILSPNLPNSRVFLVSGEEDLEELVDLLKKGKITKVILVGNPQIRNKIYERIVSEGLNNLIEIENYGQGIKEQVRVLRKFKFSKLNKIKVEAWHKRIPPKKIKELANKTIEKIQDMENLTDEDLAKIEELKLLYDEGKYFKAFRGGRKLISKKEEGNYEELKERREELREEIKNEVESLKEKVEELRGLNKEFAEKLKEKKAEEKLEIINELRGRKIEVVKKVLQGAKEINPKEVRRVIKKEVEKVREEEKGFKFLGGFKYKTECTGKIEENELDLKAMAGNYGRKRFVKIEGEVFLPNPGFRPALTREAKNKTLILKINFEKVNREVTQCLAKAEFKRIISIPLDKKEVEVQVSVNGELKTSKKIETKAENFENKESVGEHREDIKRESIKIRT